MTGNIPGDSSIIVNVVDDAVGGSQDSPLGDDGSSTYEWSDQ